MSVVSVASQELQQGLILRSLQLQILPIRTDSGLVTITELAISMW